MCPAMRSHPKHRHGNQHAEDEEEYPNDEVNDFVHIRIVANTTLRVNYFYMEALLSYYEIIVYSLTCVWILLMLTKPELRREMVVLGVFALLLLPLAFTVNTTGVDEIEQGLNTLSFLDLLFSFVLAGISGGIYHAIFGKRYHKLPKPKPLVRTSEPMTQFWLMRLFLGFLIFTWSILLIAFFFPITIPTAVFLSALLVTVYTLSHRKDLLLDTLMSAGLTGFVVFVAAWVAYQFVSIDFSIAPVVSSTIVLGVPADLLLWSVALGLAIGPMYEFIRGLELSNPKENV